MAQGHKHNGARRWIVALVAATSLATCLTGCEIAGIKLPDIKLPSIPALETIPREEALAALANHNATVTQPTIREAGTLIVGINPKSSLAPMVLSSSDGSTISGLDVDVATALADELGLNVRFVSVQNTDDACANSVDVVLSTTASSVEASTVVGSYTELASGFFHKGAAGVVDVSALQGATVGVQANSASKSALDHTALGMNAKTYTNLNDAFTALESGEVQYVLCDTYAGAYLAGEYTDISFAGTIDTPSGRGIAVTSSNTALQETMAQALTTIQNNGIMGVLRTRWVGDLPTLTAESQIANIPAAETEQAEGGEESQDGGEQTETTTESASSGGSTAGAHAITM